MKVKVLLLSFLFLLIFVACENKTTEPEEPVCEHLWSESYSVTEPTLDEEGARVYTCVLCGKTKSTPIPELSEEDYFLIVDPATCEEDGKETYVSEEWGEYEVVLPATGHDFPAAPTRTTATCTEDGEDVFVCKNCGQEKKTARYAFGHDYQVLAVHEGTCLERGYTEYERKRCGVVYNANYTDYVHEYEAGEYVEGNCTEKGYTPYVCRLCNAEKKEYTDYAHVYNKDTGKCTLCGAACEHDFRDYKCTRCLFDIREELDVRSGVYVYGDVTYFGSYPQSHVSDPDIIAELDEYFAANRTKTERTLSDGITYVKADVSLQSNTALSFSDGTVLSPAVNGRTVHYFRRDPIAWRQERNGVLVADRILDVSAFQENVTTVGANSYFNAESGVYANNWSISTARRFLSETFYQAAFNEKQKAMIEATTNDNTNSGYYEPSDSRLWCTQEETTDNVFLPSFTDLCEKDAVVDRTNAALCRKVSDYALCSPIVVDGMINGTAKWYLRSPGLSSGYVCAVDEDGKLSSSTLTYKEKEINGDTKKVGMGIVPALKVSLPE